MNVMSEKSILTNEGKIPCSYVLGDLFDEIVNNSAEKIALRYYDENVTYGELFNIKQDISKELRSCNITFGDRVCVNICNGVGLIAAILALFDVGAIYVPIDINCPKERMELIAKITGAKLLIQTKERLENIKIEDVPRLLIDQKGNTYFEGDKGLGDVLFFCEYVNEELNAESIAYIMFTSGTTGEPKGVMIKHDSVVNLLRSVKETLELKDSDSTVLITNICFDISVLEIFLPLIHGMTLCLLKKEDIENPSELKKYIEYYEVSFLQLTPSRFKQIFVLDRGYEENHPSTVEKYLLGGEKLDYTCVKVICDVWKKELYNMYGPTETTIWSSAKKIQNEISIGKPLHNTYFYILNNNGEIAEIGEKGEICIGGIGVSRGYCNNEKGNLERFVKDPLNEEKKIYRTGDIGEIRADGDIYCYGRLDHQIKLHGYRIELDEIEKAAVDTKLVLYAHVEAKDNGENNAKIVMYLIRSEGFDFQQFLAKLRAYLPSYMQPSQYVAINRIPVNDSGKVNIHNLKENEFEILHMMTEKPRNEIDEQIYNCWVELLGESSFGITDYFYDIGGTSFLYYYMLAEISKLFELDLKKLKYMECATVMNIADYIMNNGKDVLQNNNQ